ncbi:MAG: outer membrane beta-barrel protein [Gammaproteobacteria bacterium]|nr:outer membrane beta-barrel protein [Gammaproteobacteria bacterium]
MNLLRTSLKIASIATLSLAFSSVAQANNIFAQVNAFSSCFDKIGQALGCYTLDCGHWYVGGNIGVAHLHDRANPFSDDSVDENGPGGSVVGGYQINSIIGAEIGYTGYTNSREYAGSTLIAKTEHYAVHLAATARYPLFDGWSALGKLGVAYSYAQKMAIATGSAASSSTGNLYWGLGLDYSVTPTIDFIAQFAEARGNRSTGSSDLWSLGVVWALV